MIRYGCGQGLVYERIHGHTHERSQHRVDHHRADRSRIESVRESLNRCGVIFCHRAVTEAKRADLSMVVLEEHLSFHTGSLQASRPTYAGFMRSVRVSLGDRSYSILVGPGLLSQLGDRCLALGLGARCGVITDETVAPLFAEQAVVALRGAGFSPVLIRVPSGETSKSLKVVGTCYDRLAAHRLERKSFIVALGGGVVGDLAGFVASTYLRGMAFVQVPTTLLAQVDSSVGGKVGVNLKAGKNLVGAFHQPKLVLCDLDSLNTLPPREFQSGLGEVIKYGIIYDAGLFRRLERDLPKILRRDPMALAATIARCCAIKAAVVSQDENESGLRAILNYGHTIGHALEAISGYGEYLHGEAISMGQVAASHLSARLVGLDSKSVERIRNLFVAAGLPVSVSLTRRQRERLVAAMRLDKKVSGGQIKFVLARRIGEVIWGQNVPETALQEALDLVCP